jgi:hypothetical protein
MKRTVWVGSEPCLACDLLPKKCCGLCRFHCACSDVIKAKPKRRKGAKLIGEKAA